MTKEKKIMLTTSFVRNNKLYDYWEENTRRRIFRYSWPRIHSYGLRFIKQNIPQIEILEYPTWREFTEKVRNGNYDVVGFSFYINEIPDIIKMTEFARKNGVKEIWGGNYGTLTPDIEKHFDRVFVGYSEHEIAKELGIELGEIKHPPLVFHIGISPGIKIIKNGMIFSTRGCNIGCSLCQTPSFCPNPYEISMESLDAVLGYYNKLGIKQVAIQDENFGLFRNHSDKVIDLVNDNGIESWAIMTRADILSKRLDDWTERNLKILFFGLENLDQKNLDNVNKRVEIGEMLSLLDECLERRLFTGIFYMIGFEDETVESIKRDMEILSKYPLDSFQLCFLTPLPKTRLWDQIEKKYGIFDYNWRHYDAKHLVWNHPNIKPEEVNDLLTWCFHKVYTRKRFFQTGFKFLGNYRENRGFFEWLNYVKNMFIDANKLDYKSCESVS